MRNYTKFEITEGTYADAVAEFNSFDEAIKFIKDEYGADNVVDQLVQINASNTEEETSETFSFLEIYDMISES